MVAAWLVSSVFSYSASAATQTSIVSTSAGSIDRTGELLQNATLDLTEIRRTQYKTECSANEAKITDGNVSTSKAEIYCIGVNDYFVWDLGDAPAGYRIRQVKGWFTWATNDRSKGRIDAVYYATVDNPTVWIKVPDSQTGSLQVLCSVATVSDTTGTIAVGVKRIKVEVSCTSYSYGGLGEIAVYGEAQTYLDGESYRLVNPVNGSTNVLSSGCAAVAGFVVPTGCDQWQQTESSDATSLVEANWHSTASMPVTQNFTAPAADTDVTLYTWFRNSSAASSLPYRCVSRPIRFTTVAPTITAPATLNKVLRRSGNYFDITGDGISFAGGTSSGTGLTSIAMPITDTAYTLVSGGTDVDPSQSGIRVMSAGDYVFRLSATNESGLNSTFDISVSVTGSSDYGVITWTGAVSTDPFADGNWSPEMAPEDGDDVMVPSGTANSISLGGVDWPTYGAFHSLTVAVSAVVTCVGNTSVSGGRGATIKAGAISIAGKLDGRGKGFPANSGPGAAGYGGAHGGAGAWDLNSLDYPPRILPYGNPKSPVTLGSGSQSAPGGGAVHLVSSGPLALDGTIDVRPIGRGAAGSAWIECGDFSGSGTIMARGEYSDARAGAGGRVALVYDTSTFSGSVQLAKYVVTSWTTGEAGTLYEPKKFPRGTAASPADVTISGDVQYILDGGDWYWNVTVANSSTDAAVILDGGTLHLGDYVQNCGTFKIGCFYDAMPTMVSRLDVKSITLNGGCLQLPCARDNPVFKLTSLSIASGAVLRLGTGDWTYANEESGGTAAAPYGRGQTFKVSGNATIAGVLSAFARGFGRGYGYYSGNGGVAHGGATIYSGTRPGIGSVTRPTELGGAWVGTDSGTRYGGGAVTLEVAGTLTVNGRVDARALYQGAGGSILVEAAHFAGTGSLNASANVEGIRYGGGGRIAVYSPDNAYTGSMLVQTIDDRGDQTSYPGTVFVERSINTAAYAFGKGLTLRSGYTQSSFDSALGIASSASCASSDAFLGNREVTKWNQKNLLWTEYWSTRTAGTKRANVGTYRLSGLSPQCPYKVQLNGVDVTDDTHPLGRYISNAAGEIEFTASLAADVNTVSVVRVSGGGLIIYYR